jgi:PAS domain S-box-containing protein
MTKRIDLHGMTDSLFNKKDFDHSLFFTMCNNMREGAAIVEANGERKFVYCNKAFLKLFDIVSIHDIEIATFRKLRKEVLTAEAITAREKLLEEKGYFNELVEYVSVNGHSFFGEVTIQYSQTGSGRYYFIVINPVDKAFFELASLGILMVNKKGEIATVNPFIVKQFGYSKTELIGKKIEFLIPKRFHEVHLQQRKKFEQHPKDRAMGTDLYALRKDGSEFPVEVSLGHYPSDGDKYIIAFINDISLRKQAEAGLKKLNEELESLVMERTGDLNATMGKLEITESEMQKVIAFQKTLLDNVGAMIVTVNAEGIIQTFNPEAEKELGYKAEELIGKYSPLMYHEPMLVETRARELSLQLQQPVPPTMELFRAKARLGLNNDDEWMYIRKNGTKFPVQLNVTALKDKLGSITGYVGVALNISKLKQFESDLQQALEKERELSELKSRFVSMASHEFRTPLSTILSSSYLIEKYAAACDQPKRETHLHRIVSSVNMLSDILNDFLSVGKIEEGKLQVRLGNFNIKEQIISIIKEMKMLLKKKQKIWYKHSGMAEVNMDAALLKHIVMNLISNASKFSPEGSQIEITTACENKQLHFSIKDHGMGISKEDQQHLMERFFRGTNAVNIQGTGLGLHIVSKYAELMNGILKFESELEKGTEFMITFNF